jgi:hypothetical protein
MHTLRKLCAQGWVLPNRSMPDDLAVLSIKVTLRGNRLSISDLKNSIPGQPRLGRIILQNASIHLPHYLN